MKRLNKYGLGVILLAASTMSLTGCIEETFPTSGATSGQVGESSQAADGQLNGIAAYMNSKYLGSRRDWDFGYGSVMHVRDVQTQDLATADPSEFNQYAYWGQNIYQGRDYIFSQWLWGFQNKFINTTNTMIGTIDEATATDTQKGYLAAACAFRALMYLDMAREYEFLPNDKTSHVNSDGNDVTGLTVPIVKNGMTEAEARNNPRATREQMVEFILSDLQTAEKYIGYFTKTDHNLPHLDVVYGLYARLYMWIENYPEAEKYARKAIDNATTTPITKAEAMDTKTGFNDMSKWMLGGQFTKESLVSNLQNWASFLCNEATYGYAGNGGCNVMMDKAMYDRMNNTDWRKLMYKAPEGSALDGQNVYIDPTYGASLFDYASTKFRPNQGEMYTSTIASAGAYPLMRVEEMYFIEAEAAAHQDAGRGKELLISFMNTHRDPKYTTVKTSVDEVVEEIVFQKRVELWGEGQSFFDIKRLNIPCVRGYNGTNHLENEQFNTTTRPAWMNWVMVEYEENGNEGVRGYNNPDPSDKYDPWTGE